jgi:hypothetical protein
VLVRLGKVFVVFALVATLGAHWALLQTVAWTTMLASNLQSGSLHDAVTKTFDGEHPCCLCKAIAAAKKSEQKSQITFEQQKLDFPLLQENLVLIAPSRLKLFPRENLSFEPVSQKPPTPPPRGFFV